MKFVAERTIGMVALSVLLGLAVSCTGSDDDTDTTQRLMPSGAEEKARLEEMATTNCLGSPAWT